MTNITTPFAGTETTAQVQTKLSAIANYWSGTSTALSGAGSWGAVRAILNNFANAANQINNLELASSFITKLNWLNDSDNMITPLFANGEQGAWYDPAELDTMFQVSTGTTPVTAAGDPVGLILDKSQGLVLGPELVTNGDFSGGSTGWTLGTGCTVASGQVTFTGSAINVTLIQTGRPSATYNALYKIEYTVISDTLNAGEFRIGGLSGASYFSAATTLPRTVGARTIYVSAKASGTATAFDFYVTSGATSGSLVVDNISVKLIPGNHAFQANTAARPILARQPLTGVRNLVTRSNVFGSTGWARDAFGTASAPVVSATNILSPDGQNNASSIIFNINAGTTSSDASRLIQSPLLTLNAVPHTESVWLKVPSGSAIVELGISGSAGSVKDVTVTDQWTRFSTTGTPSSNLGFSIIVRGDTTPGSTTLYVYGAQLEVGSTATAYQEVVSQYDVTESGVQSIWALDFDGNDDRLATSSLVPGTDKTQVFIGVRKTTDALQASILRLGSSTSNEFRIQAPNSNLATNYAFLTRGAGGSAAVAVGIKAAPTTDVIACIGDIANDVSIIRIDGVQAGSSSTDQGSGNYLGQLYIGAEAGATLPFRGRVFSLITRFGSNMSAPQIQQAETYVNARTGAY